MPALTLDGLEESGWGEITLPKFNVREMVARTKAGAQWMHFAPSNLFTGEIAPRAQELLDEGLMQTGIVGVETWDEEIVTKVLHPHDNLRLRVVMPPDVADQSISVIASLADSLAAATQWEGVLAYFAQPSLQMVTVTCTEKGYGIANPASQHLIPTVTKVVGDESGSGTFIHPSVLNLHTMLGGVQQLDHLDAASTFCFPSTCILDSPS
eukprot:COSAG01_NODE_22793_length_841_cov_0.695418_1_plen_209_part_01